MAEQNEELAAVAEEVMDISRAMHSAEYSGDRIMVEKTDLTHVAVRSIARHQGASVVVVNIYNDIHGTVIEDPEAMAKAVLEDTSTRHTPIIVADLSVPAYAHGAGLDVVVSKAARIIEDAIADAMPAIDASTVFQGLFDIIVAVERREEGR